MNRGFKRFLYGVIFLVVLVFIIWGIYSVFSDGGDSDNVVNEKNFSSIEIIGTAKYFQLESGDISAVAEAKNPNNNKAVSFSYRFVFSDISGKEIGVLNGSDYVMPGVDEYIVSSGRFGSRVRNVEFSVINEDSEPSVESLKEDISVSDVNTKIDEDKVVISGIVENKGLLSVPSMKVIGVLVDGFGFRLFAGQTILDNIGSFDSREFEIFIPVDNEVREGVNLEDSRIFINIEK